MECEQKMVKNDDVERTPSNTSIGFGQAEPSPPKIPKVAGPLPYSHYKLF